ncbi:hypothetical protein PF002_g28333 [Phytophthora fragariae]|uniref:Uncharacterized protein n=1 Tax=Phytophthora fragariae TaxID=53985 RepID=A0A6A3W1H7_9STRA|nr:hypothetical protein PF002_g28333 [Phytophthora fragariae]
MGMRENKETVEVFDPKTNSRKREQRYVTVGGVFEEGRDLVKRLAPTLDCDTRVAFTVKLFQRSILNYSAFRGYFQNPEKGDDATVFTKLTMDDWHLMAEMEAIVGSIADLARIEVQRHDLVLSELIVLLKFAADRLYSNVFQVYNLDAPRTTTTTVASFPRCC